jgi:hypothetical protein
VWDSPKSGRRACRSSNPVRKDTHGITAECAARSQISLTGPMTARTNAATASWPPYCGPPRPPTEKIEAGVGHRDRSAVPAAARKPLRRTSTATSCPPVARTPDGADRPAGVCVVMAVGAAGGWHDDPAALGVHEVTDEVVFAEVVARFGHGDVLPRTTDNECPQIRQGFRRPVDPGK